MEKRPGTLGSVKRETEKNATLIKDKYDEI